MQLFLSILDRLIAQLKVLQPLPEQYQRNLDRKIRLEFSYNSNHIEGNTLTYGETELLLIFGKTEGHHEFREYEEMEAHDVAFKIIKEWAADNEIPLTEMAIKNLNETLLVKPYWKEAITSNGQPTHREIKVGNYKEFPNHVRLQNGELFEYTLPADTPIQMGELIEWYRMEEAKHEMHPVKLAALLHYRFVRIHPFDDGNGRISRLLMNYVLLKHNLPPIVIKSSDKKNYLFALNQADTGNMEAFVSYIIDQLVWSLQLSIKAAKGESLDEPGDLDKKISLLKKKMGEDPNEIIQYKKGKIAIQKVVADVVPPLAAKWEDQLQKFETLFTARDVTVILAQISFGDKTLPSLVSRLHTSLESNWSQLKNLEQLTISVYLTGLRSKEDNTQLLAGQFSVSFFENTYVISYNSSDKKINKLYHQILNEKEINTITESLGNWFYERLEETMRLK